MKEKIFLDFDGTIVDSVKSYCKVYNQKWIGHDNFIEADHTKVNKWNLGDQCPLSSNNVEQIFKSDLFFHNLGLMNENTLEILTELKEEYQVIICSVGTPSNVSKKVEWCNRYLQFEDMIMLCNREVKMDKSIVNMAGGIIIDDHEDNLFSSNADIKICFGETKGWNENWQGLRAKNWTELAEILL